MKLVECQFVYKKICDYLSLVALIAESGIRPEANPNGRTTLHSGSRIHVIGLGLIKIYPGLVHPNVTSDPCS